MNLPEGWRQISDNQIEHRSKRLRIEKLVFKASGGGKVYTIYHKDKRNHWTRHPESFEVLNQAITLAGKLL